MKYLAGLLFSTMLIALPRQVLAEKIVCEFTQSQTAHFVPPKITVDLDSVRRVAVIEDRQFDALTTAPMVGEVVTSNNIRRTVVWVSPLISRDFYKTSYNRTYDIEFRLTIMRNNKKSILTYAARQFERRGAPDTSGRGEGICRLAES